MLVLLPPSESKLAPPRRGRPVDLEALSFPELTPARRSVLAALMATSSGEGAPARLGVGASLAAQVAANTRLPELPAVPVHRLYTGVLYDALGWDALSTSARRRAGRRLVVCSALWGALRPADRVPPYRLSMDADLDVPFDARPGGLGPLARFWRPVLAGVLEAAAPTGLVVDCRSATYAAAWAPAPGTAARTVAVRVLREGADGGRTVVSHLAKHTRGELARHLLELPADPRRPQHLVEALAPRWRGELHAPTGRPGARTWTLDVVLPWAP